MRKDFINILAKASKKLHLQRAAYNMLRRLPIAYSRIDAPEQYLDLVSPEKKNSCICTNSIEEHPLYDLQIIIPVYNVEQYLEQCILSIINQKTHYTYKAIFVNDGSTDNSRAILEKYHDNAHIAIIDTPNQGVAAARNMGLKSINARYVMFVDSDDFLTDDAIELLVTKADDIEADIVEGNYIFFQDKTILSVNKHHHDNDSYIGELGGVPWGKVYRASIWKNLQFPRGCFFEDMINRMLIYPQNLKMATISNVIYNYRRSPNGLVLGNNKNPKRIDAYWGLKLMLQDATQLPVNKDLLYAAFLKQCYFATMRVTILGDKKANFAVFDALRRLQDTYFSDCNAKGEKEKRIESALLKDDFKEYLLYCLFLY